MIFCPHGETKRQVSISSRVSNSTFCRLWINNYRTKMTQPRRTLSCITPKSSGSRPVTWNTDDIHGEDQMPTPKKREEQAMRGGGDDLNDRVFKVLSCGATHFKPVQHGPLWGRKSLKSYLLAYGPKFTRTLVGPGGFAVVQIIKRHIVQHGPLWGREMANASRRHAPVIVHHGPLWGGRSIIMS